MSQPPLLYTLGELRKEGRSARTLREEIRTNLLGKLRGGEKLFPGILGYDDSVIPAVENALLSGHDLIFLGERGQAKSRMIRALVDLLDEWSPEVAGSEIHDDPLAPVSAFARQRVAERGDDTEIAWVHREDRYVEKLATPDVSIADLIGDVDPVKVAEGRSLSDDTNRGIFCINELPDLTEKVQVGLFNVMQERDVQVKGYRVRLPLDVMVVASANPEDYTSRGRIITPLKDRYAAQVRTHYPETREVELEVVRQEARVPTVEGIRVEVPEFMEALIGEITLQARGSPDVNQTSGVSVRVSISNYETLIANAIRRAIRCGEEEAVPRISDLDALVTSTAGKLELEYAGEDRSEASVVRELIKRATRLVFGGVVPVEGVASVVESFNQGWNVEVSAGMPGRDYLEGLDEIRGLREAATRLVGGDSPERLASAIEFILEGLHLSNRLNKTTIESGARYTRS
jgi:magnesium chelatase subunit I